MGNTVRNETPRKARQFHFCEDEASWAVREFRLALAYGDSVKTRLLGECITRDSHFLYGVLEAAKHELTVSTPVALPTPEASLV